jgi:hypothetical protein
VPRHIRRLGRFDFELEAHHPLASLGQLIDHSDHLHVPPFERRRQRPIGVGRGPPACQPRPDYRTKEQRHRHDASNRPSQRLQGKPGRQRTSHQACVSRPLPQRRLLQLKRSSQHRACHRGETDQAARFRAQHHETTPCRMQITPWHRSVAR